MAAVTDDQRVIRRSIDLHTLDLSDPDSDLSAALEALTSGRLIVVDEDTASLIHEALLYAWPRLRNWIKDNISQIRVQAQLHDDATVWATNHGDPAYLYRGTRLELAQAGISQPNSELTARFLRASRRAYHRRRTLIRATAAALVVLTAISVISAIFALQARNLAVGQRNTAISERIALARQGVTDPTLSALLAVAAWRIAPSSAARNALATAALSQGRVTISFSGIGAQSLAISPDGRTLVTGGADGTVRLWDTATRRSIATLTGHTDGIGSVAFSPDGRTLVTGGADGTVRLWDTATRRSIATLTGHTDGIGSVAFSPDGRTLVTGGADGTVRLWDTATRRSIATLTGHIGPVLSAAFSPDGKTLATGSTDNTVRLWDMSTRQPIGQPEPVSGNGITQVVFSPDGSFVATVGSSPAGQTSTLRLLNVPDVTTVTGLINTICTRAGRDLTSAEWVTYIPDLPYQRTCPD
jgi:hypothetical protein